MHNDPVLFRLTSELGFSFATSIIREGFHLSCSANFNQNQIMNRSSPIITYSNTNAMTLAIMLELYALYGDPKTNINDVINSFRALQLPQDPGVQPPSLCKITLGELLTDWECVLVSVDIHYGNNNLYDENGNSHTAALSCQFMGIEVENSSAEDYVRRGDFRYLAL